MWFIWPTLGIYSKLRWITSTSANCFTMTIKGVKGDQLLWRSLHLAAYILPKQKHSNSLLMVIFNLAIIYCKVLLSFMEYDSWHLFCGPLKTGHCSKIIKACNHWDPGLPQVITIHHAHHMLKKNRNITKAMLTLLWGKYWVRWLPEILSNLDYSLFHDSVISLHEFSFLGGLFFVVYKLFIL